MADDPVSGKLLLEGSALEPGTMVPLKRTRSPWKLTHGAERVIVGCREKRSDVLLRGEGIRQEHLRVYIDVKGGPTDLRALESDSTRVDSVAVEALAYTPLYGGETIDIGSWRFRYEVLEG